MRFRSFVLALLLLLGTACTSVAPTPILIGKLVDLNNETMALYVACSEGANYVPTKEGCASELLSVKVDETRTVAIHFIRADLNQPHGYDIHLSISLIYFRIALRNFDDYSFEEQLARQFFKIQEANSSSSIDASRYWLTLYVTSAAAQLWFDNRLPLTPERKIELIDAFTEGNRILNKEGGTRLVRLTDALGKLKLIIDSIQ